jgi:hypothetical protein
MIIVALEMLGAMKPLTGTVTSAIQHQPLDLLAVGVARTYFPHAGRARLSSLSALVVLAFGVMTILRGLDWIPHPGEHHLH